MAQRGVLTGKLLIVAFEGWNDAGEAASGAVSLLRRSLGLVPLHEADPEDYFDYQFTRPSSTIDEDGQRTISWPEAVLYGPAAQARADSHLSPPISQADSSGVASVDGANASSDDADGVSGDEEDAARTGSDATSDQDGAAGGEQGIDSRGDDLFVLLGDEPARRWKAFVNEFFEQIEAQNIQAIILLGAMLSDVPHSRPIAVTSTSNSALVRENFALERSNYEGPTGILGVLGWAAEQREIPTISIWAQVPHYVASPPSPKATLALINELEKFVDVRIPRGELPEEASAWESGINALAADDDDMTAYIEQLERARDTVDSPEASGDAIAEEFERYLQRRDKGPETGPAVG